MKLKRIKINEDIKPFDCGDADLNGFLLDDAVAFHSKHIGKTFVIEDAEDKNKHTRLMFFDMNELY